jgi:hypothetical protein
MSNYSTPSVVIPNKKSDSNVGATESRVRVDRQWGREVDQQEDVATLPVLAAGAPPGFLTSFFGQL